MHRTRIKICGITRAEDAAVAVACGADAIGFVFAPSPRQVTLAQAAEVAASVPPPVARVGVFVNPDPGVVEEVIAEVGLTAVQLCGDESPELCSDLSIPVVKVLRVGIGFDWSEVEPYRGHAAALLLDTFVPGKAGGTSQAFDWRSIGESPVWAHLFIAGGLTADNVADAIRALRPFAVDVSSGVESAPGVKGADRVAAFCAAVHTADMEDSRT
jgi:phosphoribosylanthranilate isomerase